MKPGLSLTSGRAPALPENLRPPLEVLAHLASGRGQEIHLTGGTLRDLLLGIHPPDVDLAAAGDALALGRAAAKELDGVFVPLKAEMASCRLVLPGLQIDLTGLRGPNLEADLRARDFTVNALAVELGPCLAGDAGIIDPTGGLADLKAGVLRAAGPGVLADDPLRVLRGFRFMSSHGLSPTPDTAQRLRRAAPLLAKMPSERVGHEWLIMMAGENVARAVDAMARSGVLGVLIPELEAGRGVMQNPFHHLDVLGHCLATVTALADIAKEPAAHLGAQGPEVSDYLSQSISRGLLFTAALLHDVGKTPTRQERSPGWATFYAHDTEGARLARGICRRLGLSKAASAQAAHIISIHMRPFHLLGAQSRTGLSARAVRRLLQAADQDLPGLMALAMADTIAGKGPQRPADAESRLADLYAQVAEMRDAELAAALLAPPLINGHHLMAALEIGKGKEVGRLLSLVREAQLDGEISAKQEALELAKRLHRDEGQAGE